MHRNLIAGLVALTVIGTAPSVQAQLREYLNSPAAAAETAESRAVVEYVATQLESLEHAEPGRYCGTGLLQYITRRRDVLSPSAQSAIAAAIPAAIVRPTYADEKTYDVPGAPFRIHFTLTGADSVRNASSDTAADGIPTYVHVTADVLVHSLELLVDSLGFAPLLSDGTNGGGVDLYDCYLIKPTSLGFPPNVIGFNTTDTTTFQQDPITSVWTAASFLVVHPTMEPFEQLANRLDLLRITCAHELFHAIHFALDFEEQPDWQTGASWWQEGTSTWFEDYAYPEVNDWTNIEYYMVLPWQSLMTSRSLSLHVYGGGQAWCFYLVERFGGPDVIRAIWDGCGLVAGDNTLAATTAALNPHGVTVNEAWLEFTNWCMRTGSHWDDSSFAQGAAWPEPARARTYFNYPQASMTTDKTDTLGKLIDPSIPVDTLSNDFPAKRLEGMAFMPIAYVPFPTTTDSMSFFAAGESGLPVSFYYGGRNRAVFPERIEYKALPAGVSTLVPDWLAFDSVFFVAATGPYFPGGPGTEVATNTPMIVASLDTNAGDGSLVVLNEPYPNPVNIARGEAAKFEITLLSPQTIYLDIYSMSGDLVRSIAWEDAISTIPVFWDGTNDSGNLVASGMYLCRLKVGSAEKVYRVGIVR